MLILVRKSLSEKAHSPMLVTLFGMLMLLRDLQPLKALFPIVVTESGMSILVRKSQSEKAHPPILVTLSGMT